MEPSWKLRGVAVRPVFRRCGRLAACGLLVAVLALLAMTPPVQAQVNWDTEKDVAAAGHYLLAAANRERAMQGVEPLRLDPVLSAAAAVHAREMAAHASISHQFDDEPGLAARGAKAGAHFSLITENVAEAPNSALIHDLWMHSEGHRTNLLDAKVDAIGIAIARRDDQLYAVEDFARSVNTLTLEQQERAVADLLLQSGMQVLARNQEARQTCAMSKGSAGMRQPWFVMRYTASSLRRIPEQLMNRLVTGKYHQAVVGACPAEAGPFTAYNIAVLLFP